MRHLPPLWTTCARHLPLSSVVVPHTGHCSVCFGRSVLAFPLEPGSQGRSKAGSGVSSAKGWLLPFGFTHHRRLLLNISFWGLLGCSVSPTCTFVSTQVPAHVCQLLQISTWHFWRTCGRSCQSNCNYLIMTKFTFWVCAYGISNITHFWGVCMHICTEASAFHWQEPNFSGLHSLGLQATNTSTSLSKITWTSYHHEKKLWNGLKRNRFIRNTSFWLKMLWYMAEMTTWATLDARSIASSWKFSSQNKWD